MKRVLIIFMLIFCKTMICHGIDTVEKINKYSQKNSRGLTELYNNGKNIEYVRFILDYSSPNDIAVLKPEYIVSNIELALKSKELEYASLYDDTVFKHFVLPLRASQEPFEDWRKRFYDELYPKVKDIKDIEKAAIVVNLWALEQMTYKPTHGKDQGPLTTIKRGYGRCEEMMIIFMAAARSVGIPVRSAGTPLWNFTDSNHAWVEVWTPSGWKYLGEPADRLNSAWFTKTTKRASVITSRAFGYYDGEDVIEQSDLATVISSIKYYTDEWDNCIISIDDENGMPVRDAEVVLYAFSWGGIAPMFSVKTDVYGQVTVPLGKGTVYVGAYKEGTGANYSVFNTLKGSKDIRIQLKKDHKFSKTDISFKFQIENNKKSVAAEEKRYFEDKFDLLKKNASLKRDKRLNSQKSTEEFAKYFLKSVKYEDNGKFYDEQSEFLKKCDQLGGNTEHFLNAYTAAENTGEERRLRYRIITEMIKNWDIKELCEIPDSAKITEAVDVYHKAYNRYKKSVPDTVFVQNVISPTWTSAQVPQNGWQKEFYEMIKDMGSSNLKTTLKDVVSWAGDNLTVDPAFEYYYYSSPLNPVEILNMKSVPEFYRTKLIDIALKTLGVPTRWSAQLEYYDGKEFVFVEPGGDKGQEKVNENTLRVKLMVDGEQIKADPWSNFLMSELSEGKIGYYNFDGKSDSLDFIIKYPAHKDRDLLIQAGVRNVNGDANVSIFPLTQFEDEIIIELETPREYLDLTSDFKDKDIAKIKDYVTTLKIPGSKVMMVRGVVPNEPTDRMTDLLLSKSSQFLKKEASLIIYTELRDDNDIEENKNVVKKGGDILIQEMEDDNYPLIFLFDKKNELKFAYKGYNMNIADLLLKKVGKD
ncbi:MAG: transglutaminase domain-containing protein [Candidatus Delongbacteria bacterium]